MNQITISRRLLWILLNFVVFIQTCNCEGIFQLQLLAYKNHDGKDVNGLCCGHYTNSEAIENANLNHCSMPCSTFFRICLKQYQNSINPEPPCTYGSIRKRAPQAGNLVDFSSSAEFQEPMLFPFKFAWPGDLSVIIEAWHNSTAPEIQDSSNGLAAANVKQLLMRVAERKTVDPGPEWISETVNFGSSALEFQYRVMCEAHYHGRHCMNYCKAQDSAVAHYTCSENGQRICMPGWDGANCDKPQDSAVAHYTCSENGQRICMPGWNGANCDKPACLPGCHPEFGSCKRPNECICKLGYQGSLCNECIKYPGCKHGFCEKPWECQCEEGWGGIFCNQDLNFCTHHRPCLNGATCENTGQGHYTCICRPGYTGTNCENKIENCDMSPCLNGGLCTELETNYTCSCPLDFSGRHCQINARTCADDPCRNGATCMDSAESYECFCAPGYTGANCDIERDECESDPCLNGGRCIDQFNGFSCVCPVGFEGARCERNIDDCSATTCQNGGKCVDDINNFRCECPPGFSGTLCQYNIDDCVKRPCANGGTCFDLVNDYRCFCRPGFSGKGCSIDINECASFPCRSGGSCEDLVADYKCHCGPCFTGKNCETRNDDCDWSNPFVATPPSFVRAAGFPAAPAKPEEQKSSQRFQQTLIIIVIPVIVAFTVIVLVLTAIVFWMWRRSKKEASRPQDPESRQNDRNQRIAARTSPDFVNNKFVSAFPAAQTAIISPYSGDLPPPPLQLQKTFSLSKVDNSERSSVGGVKGINLDRQPAKVDNQPYPLAVTDRNTFKANKPVCKAVSVEKLNFAQKYRNQHHHHHHLPNLDPNRQLKGFEGRGCISPQPQSPRDPLPPLKTEISKDSGLGSPTDDFPSPQGTTSVSCSLASSEIELCESTPAPGVDEGCRCVSATPGRCRTPRGGELIVCATGIAGKRDISEQKKPAPIRTRSGSNSRNLQQLHRHPNPNRLRPEESTILPADNNFATQV